MQFGLVKETSKYLESLKGEMIAADKVTVENKYPVLFDEFSYFKESAFRKYAENPPEPIAMSRDEEGRSTSWSCELVRPVREGSYHAEHSLYSFFSWLEHVLLLLYPFSKEYDPSRLNEFLGMRWGDKWVSVFEARDKAASKSRNMLQRIANEYRNFYVYGEVRCGGESFAFHMPGTGAVSFLEPHDKLAPLGQDGFLFEARYRVLVEKIDKIVDLMGQSKLGLAMKFAQSGVSVPSMKT